MTNSVLSNTSSSTIVSLEEARLYLEQLDLTYIAQAMCAEHYPLPRWTMDNATACLQLYKNFLLLTKKHWPQSLVPTRQIDEFWHNHILYTQNYFNDCQQIFGHYLHHLPASPDEDPDQLVKAFSNTKQLYFAEFNQALLIISDSR